MKNTALCLSGLSLLVVGLSSARADTVPQEGTRELRLGSSAGMLGLYSPGIASLSPKKGNDLTFVSLGFGMGYFVSPNVEVGGTVGYFQMSSDGQKISGPGFSGFLRLYSRTGNVGIFAEPTLEFQYLSQGKLSAKILGPGIDVGVEFFLADSWALRVSPTYRYYKEWVSSGGSSDETSIQKFGLTWGISAYF